MEATHSAIGLPIRETIPAQLFELIWHETWKLRRESHAGHGCPTVEAPYGASDPSGLNVADACRFGTCLDLVHDIYANVAPRLQERLRRLRESDRLNDAVPYTRQAVRTEVADVSRRWRVQRGLPAKPSRSDGVPGRVIAQLTNPAVDPLAAYWYVVLFRMMRSYVCRPSAPGRGWPLDGWIQEEAKIDGHRRAIGSEAARRKIRSDIAHILVVATEVAGHRWVYDNITGPLQVGSEPLPMEAVDDGSRTPPVVSPEDAVGIGLVRTRFAELIARGIGSALAAHSAVLYGFGIDLPRSRGAVDHLLNWFDVEFSETR